MRFRSLPLALLLAGALVGAGCDVRVGENGVSVDVAGGKASDEWRRTYTVAKGGSVEVANTNGAIVVEAAAGNQVEVRATRQTRASSDEEAQDLLKKLEIKEDVSPGRLSLKTVTVGGALFGRRSATVEYHLKVPAGLQITVKTENGAIGLHDINGTITAATTNGGIRGTNISGGISAHIVNGGIVAEMTTVSGPVELETVNGGIRVEIPPDAKADVESSAVNGGVSIDESLVLTGGARTRTRLSGKLNGGGTKLNASTVNGGVRITSRTSPGLHVNPNDRDDDVVVDRTVERK